MLSSPRPRLSVISTRPTLLTRERKLARRAPRHATTQGYWATHFPARGALGPNSRSLPLMLCALSCSRAPSRIVPCSLSKENNPPPRSSTWT